jgi:hypothetical protein
VTQLLGSYRRATHRIHQLPRSSIVRWPDRLEHAWRGPPPSTVLHDCQANSLEERAAGLAAIARRARAGALTPEDSTGGTITVSNLGMAGVETGVPLLNAPQSCIVFTGATVDKPSCAPGR